MKPSDVIAQLEATPGRLDKEAIVRRAWDQGCVEFFQGAKLAYDALVTFGVKKAPLIEDADQPGFVPSMDWIKFTALLERLRTRQLTGNAARDALLNAADASSTVDWNGWYRRLLLKDLKCGVTDSTINKVLESIGGDALQYTIPVFSCQLAKNADDHPKKMKGWKLLDPKLDGVRILTIFDIEAQTVTQYSRDGRQNDRFDAITDKMSAMLPQLKQSIVLDGEMVSRSFQELMKQLNRKSDVDTSDAKLALFDIIPLDAFRAGEYAVKQTERQDILVGFIPMLQAACGESVYVIPKKAVNLDTVDGQEEFKRFNNDTLNQGLEGVMLKDPNAPYKTKRTDAWLKIKPVYSVDVEIIGFEPGKPDSKFKNTLGGLICRGIDHGKLIEVTVGGGYSEELRDQIWSAKHQIIGQIIEVKGDCLTKNQDSDNVWSIRFPVFVTFRGFDPGQKI